MRVSEWVSRPGGVKVNRYFYQKTFPFSKCSGKHFIDASSPRSGCVTEGRLVNCAEVPIGVAIHEDWDFPKYYCGECMP